MKSSTVVLWLFSCSWWYNVDRKEADKQLLLPGNPTGTFLVREAGGSYKPFLTHLWSCMVNIYLDGFINSGLCIEDVFQHFNICLNFKNTTSIHCKPYTPVLIDTTFQMMPR